MPDDDASTPLLHAAAALLYGLRPGEFTARRDQLAADARSAGDPAQAKAIKALRRPTASAWLVNALVREDGEEIRQLLALGEQARAGEGGDPADLIRRRRAVVQAALRRARVLARDAGESSADAVLRDVESTLEAVIADEGAANAVRTGRLQRPLRSGGFDAVDLDGAVGGAPAPPQPGRPTLTVISGGRAERPTTGAADDRGGSRAPARRVGAASARGGRAAPTQAAGASGAERTAPPRDGSREEAAAERALAEFDRASRAAQEARAAALEIQHEIEGLRARRAELERELASTQEAQSAAQQRAAQARRLSVDADRKLAAASRRAAQAQQRLDAARSPDPDGG